MSISLANRINSLRGVDGNFSSKKINSKSNQLLKAEIVQATSFLPVSRTIPERIFCIQNTITQTPVCPHTGEYLKWSPSKHCYSQSKKSMYINRVTNHDNLKQRYNYIKKSLKDKYTSGNYNFIEPIPLIYKYSTNIKLWDIEKNYDLFCSVLYKTNFLSAAANWKERFYCLTNNITSRPTSKDGGPSRFINSLKGYSTYSTKADRHLHILNLIETELSKKFKINTPLINLNKQQRVNLQCKDCGTEKDQLVICGLWQDAICNKCTGLGLGRSKPEEDICNIITAYSLEVLKNVNINGVEVDLYIPEKNIGIEYNGILWHSFGTTYPNNINLENKNKKRHLLKKTLCSQAGINLLTIFENEWLLKRDITLSIILAKLGIFDNKLYARKCQLVTLSKESKKDFYIQNHIQGNCQSFIDYGLMYGGKLVAAMSFSRRKINKSTNVELVRFCCLKQTQVIGGFSKLLKHAKGYIKEDIISYCDLRYSDGKSYIKNGFELLHTSAPNYFYTKNALNLENRIGFQKHKLVKFNSYDPEKTESAMMYNEGYRKIYDCGNLVLKISN